jgi:predicted nucleic acid-binding protein
VNGSSLVLDTNIALYLLSGDRQLAKMIDGVQIYVSFITELELLGYKKITATEHKSIKLFLADCIIIDINDTIKEHVIMLRKRHTLALPDSIIAATTLFLEIPLFTADSDYTTISDLPMLLYAVK